MTTQQQQKINQQIDGAQYKKIFACCRLKIKQSNKYCIYRVSCLFTCYYVNIILTCFIIDMENKVNYLPGYSMIVTRLYMNFEIIKRN